MKALVYLRVSTDDQAEKGYSIQAQRVECMNRAIELGCNIKDVNIFADEGVSGVILERPQLMAALNMLKKKSEEIKFFICYDSSRLSRNAAHQLIIVDEIKKYGVQLIFIRNSFQDNAEGRFQLTVMAAVDEYERTRLRLRTEMGKRAKASQHKLTHNPGLYGYDFDSKADILKINEEQRKNLKLMYELLINELRKPTEIAEILNEADIPSPRLKLWSRVTVRRILSNPSYMGILYIRRYDTRDCHLNKYRAKGEKVKVREKPQDEWIPVEIPQLIDRGTWEKAQIILKSSKQSKRKNGNTEFFLDSVLKCGNCGSTMVGKRVVKGDNSYCYYICSGKYKGSAERKCETALIRADELEKEVWDLVYRRICTFLDKGFDAEKLIAKMISKQEGNCKNIIAKKEKAKKEKERIKIMFQKGYIIENEMVEKLERIEAMLAKLDSEADGDDAAGTGMSKLYKINSSKGALPYIMKEVLSGLECEERKVLLELLVSEIIISGKTVLVSTKA